MSWSIVSFVYSTPYGDTRSPPDRGGGGGGGKGGSVFNRLGNRSDDQGSAGRGSVFSRLSGLGSRTGQGAYSEQSSWYKVSVSAIHSYYTVYTLNVREAW